MLWVRILVLRVATLIEGLARLHAHGVGVRRHWRGWIQRGIDATLYGAADLLTDASAPISLHDAVATAAPTPVLLVAGAGDGRPP